MKDKCSNKLNTNGSLNENLGLSGFGGVFKKHLGNWLGGYACPFGHTTNTNVELACNLSRSHHCSPRDYFTIICESDDGGNRPTQ